jgi:hypothetical protein
LAFSVKGLRWSIQMSSRTPTVDAEAFPDRLGSLEIDLVNAIPDLPYDLAQLKRHGIDLNQVRLRAKNPPKATSDA